MEGLQVEVEEMGMLEVGVTQELCVVTCCMTMAARVAPVHTMQTVGDFCLLKKVSCNHIVARARSVYQR